MSQSYGDAGGLMSQSADRRVVAAPSRDERISAIYEAIGEALDLDPGVDPIPLQEAIDPEALAHMFNEHSGEAYVSFPVADCRVTVHSDGEVLVHELD